MHFMGGDAWGRSDGGTSILVSGTPLDTKNERRHRGPTFRLTQELWGGRRLARRNPPINAMEPKHSYLSTSGVSTSLSTSRLSSAGVV